MIAVPVPGDAERRPIWSEPAVRDPVVASAGADATWPIGPPPPGRIQIGHLGTMKAIVCLSAVVALTPLIGTPARADDAEAARLCRGDAFRLCLSEIPDRDRITACMVRNRTRLSPGCQTVFNKPSRPATVETASRTIR